MKKCFLSIMIACLLALSGWAKTDIHSIVTNPMNLNYRFQYDDPGYREAADPVCEYFKGKYYLFASKSGGYWSSPDLAEWTYIPCTSITELDNYAPTILVRNDSLYFMASNSKIYRTDNPDNDSWQRIDTRFNLGVTDPAFFQDDDGKVYIYWGCSDKDPIQGVEVNPLNGFAPIGKPAVLIEHHQDNYGWEVQGENNELGTPGWNEGPCMIKYKGKYYLQYASPGTQFRTYADGLYVSDQPLGPFTYMEHSPFSIKPGGFIGGAGHGHTFLDKYGNYWHVASMKISQRHMFERRLGLFPVYFTGDDELYAHSEWSDYPFSIPNEKVDFQTDNRSLNWNGLSYKKTATASSYYRTYLPAKAADESVETIWSAQTGNPGEWWRIDLGKSMQVNAIQVNFADQDFTVRAPHAPFVYQYVIETSGDGETWAVLVDKTQNTRDAVHELIVLETPVETRYLRISNRKELPGKFSLYDFRVFGTGNATTSLPDEVSGFQALRKNDRRRFLIRWDKQDKATGYILRWGVHPDRLNRAVMVYDNQLEAGYFNADSPYYFSIDAFNEKGVTRGNTVIEGAVFFGEPYSGDPPEIPCTLEAEDFNEGGQGFAYYDTSPRNTFGLYRDTDVDIDYSRGIDAYFLANTADGEYLNYTLRVPETGFYHFDCIGAAVNTSGGFYLSFNGEKVDKPSLTSLPTGTVGNFRTTRLPDVLFNQGIQVMTFHPYDNIYVDKFIISRSGTGIRLPDKPVLSVHPNPSSGIFNIRIPQNVFLSVYTLAGRRISPEILIQSTYNLDITNKPAGIYFLVLRTDDQVCRLKLIKK